MRHLEVESYGADPCGGKVMVRHLVENAEGPRRSLPVLGVETQKTQWHCERCGKVWPYEPRPEEAL